MALQLRRGTDAERELVTFAEGELVYVTDTKQLFVGDGETLGGVRIANDLEIVEGNNYRISIIGDDSTTIVNSQTNDVTSSVLLTENAIVKSSLTIGSDDQNMKLNYVVDNARSIVVQEYLEDNKLGLLHLNRFSKQSILNKQVPSEDSIIYTIANQVWDGTDYITGSSMSFSMEGETTPGISKHQFSLIMYNQDGSFTPSNGLHYISSQKIGVMTNTPQETLDVNGTAKFSGYVQFGSYSRLERDALSPTNGTVIYNTTIERFQGYQNGAWINFDDGTIDV